MEGAVFGKFVVQFSRVGCDIQQYAGKPYCTYKYEKQKKYRTLSLIKAKIIKLSEQ